MSSPREYEHKKDGRNLGVCYASFLVLLRFRRMLSLCSGVACMPSHRRLDSVHNLENGDVYNLRRLIPAVYNSDPPHTTVRLDLPAHLLASTGEVETLELTAESPCGCCNLRLYPNSARAPGVRHLRELVCTHMVRVLNWRVVLFLFFFPQSRQ